jgi:hypothetical protein
MTSNLQENNWAVLSERGCEATDLTHEDARRLVHRLEAEGRHGLCIVTNAAAARSARPQRASDLAGARERS